MTNHNEQKLYMYSVVNTGDIELRKRKYENIYDKSWKLDPRMTKNFCDESFLYVIQM